MVPMRRMDKQVSAWPDILDIVERSPICRIAMQDGSYPYIVPMYFGYTSSAAGKLTLYLHGATSGRTLSLLQQNGRVGFELEASWSIVWNESDITDNTVPYESIIGTGQVHILQGTPAKRAAMEIFLKRYRKEKPFSFPDERLDAIVVYKLTAQEVCAKRSTT